jgi:hypothetical protein
MEQDKTTMMGENGAVVEADWTFVGGTLSNMNHARRERARRKKFNGKAIVHAMRERRTGTVRATVMPDTTRHPIKQEFDAHLAPGARIYTDEAVSYSYPAGWYRHQSVNHSAGEYTRGTVHVNGCENFFRCLRMGLRGTYVRTTPDHLQSYADETVFRFNHKTAGEWQRFEALMRRIVGRRLTYSTLTDGAVR